MLMSYITSAGLDCGLAIAVIAIFLTLSLPKGGIDFNWWGNVDVYNTAVRNPTDLLTERTSKVRPYCRWVKTRRSDHPLGDLGSPKAVW
jgi:hypothetical protein